MSENYRLGIIDFGTVAIRLDVYQVSQNRKVNLIHRHRALPRLGEVLSDVAEFRKRVLQELEAVMLEAKAGGAEELLAVGTSAFRDLSNRAELVQEIKDRFDITFEILTGEVEAALTARGILKQEPNLPNEVVLVDIGGGSTEVSFCRGGEALSSASLDIGCLGMKRALEQNEASACLSHFAEWLKQVRGNSVPELAVGSSGTIRSIERILSFGGRHEDDVPVYNASELRILLAQLLPLSPQALLEVPGVEENRADIVIPGVLLFESVLSAFEIETFRVSHYSLRHGVLVRWLEANS